MKIKTNIAFFFLTCSVGSFAQNKISPKDTEVWEPVPEIVSVNEKGIPSDAIILLSDKVNEFVNHQGEPIAWTYEDGIMTVAPRKKGEPKNKNVYTKQKFGDCQLHLEFRTPIDNEGVAQRNGNSGVFLQTLYEIQVLNSHKNVTYSNGQLGAIYKQSIPMANPAKPMGEWQTYDIVFTAPVWEGNKVVKKASMTAFINGVLVQNHFELGGPTTFVGKPKYAAKDHGKKPLMLQEHNNYVSYRNIWIREL